MSSQRRSKTITANSFGTNAIGLAILLVPIASIWYLLRNSSGQVDDERAIDDLSSDDEDLAYGSDSGSNSNPDDRGPIVPVISLHPSSAPGSPAKPPLAAAKAKKKSKESELGHLGFAAACAAGLSGADFDPNARIHIPSRPCSQDGDSPGSELVNAGTMQVKGIRSVRGDMGDYMGRD